MPWVNPLNTAGGTIPASSPAIGSASKSPAWGSNLTFNPESYRSYQSSMPAGFFTTQPVGVSFAPPSYGPAPTVMPQGAVSNWKDFMQGLLGTGVQYLLQKDAEKRARKLQEQGVDAVVIPHPGGGYAVQERQSFFSSPAGIAVIVGGVVVLIFALTRGRKK